MADLLMPKFGLTMTEGTVSQWHVSAGDSFAAGDILFTVETEKVANEVEAETGGIMAEILVAAGETVPVGTTLARLGDGVSGDETDSAAATDAAKSPAPAGVRDAPSARKLMDDHGIAPGEVSGTGRDGRIMKEDVLRVVATPLARRIAKERAVDLRRITGSGPKGRIKAEDVRNSTPTRAPSAPGGSVTVIIPDDARLATARRVSAAKRDIPHFHVTHEAEIGALDALRKELNADGDRTRISVTHMLVRAIGLALAEMPAMNRIWANDTILSFATADIGMVAETPGGLRIPVLRDTGNRNLDEIAADAADLTARARGGALTPADVGDSVISISNVGMFGVTSLTPIINPPNAMILGVGAERQVFRPDDRGQPALRREMTLTLACDHRVIDGADAARFLSRIVGNLEAPTRLLRPARPAA